jgi:hypothetical protein
MREYSVYVVAAQGGTYYMPVSMWAERLSSQRAERGTVMALFNCKRDAYQGNPRLAIGDNGEVIFNVDTSQASALKRTVHQLGETAEKMLTLPQGLQPFQE